MSGKRGVTLGLTLIFKFIAFVCCCMGTFLG